MFGFGKSTQQHDINSRDLHRLLTEGAALVIDVREPGEYAAERIAGALNLPLSRFDPAQIPDAPGQTIVLQCAGGGRSATALGRCAQAGAAIDTHLAGGLAAWKAAGLPTERGA